MTNPINKKFIVYSIIIGVILILFFLLKNAYLELDIAQERLSVANNAICTLKKDNSSLLEYTQQKDIKLKQIEKEYDEILSNIPKDHCGDVKPSKELLDYLKRNTK